MKAERFETVMLEGHEVPVVPLIHNRILREIEARPELFDMKWYDDDVECGTSHCYAGWAVALAGNQGKQLDGILHADTQYTAELILQASCPWLDTSNCNVYQDFSPHVPQDVALARIRERAAEECRRLAESDEG